MVSHLPQTVVVMKECVPAINYNHNLQLSFVRKSRLLAESAYQILRAVPLLNQLPVGHTNLLVPFSPSQETEGSKAHYDLVEEKVVSFERECYKLRVCLSVTSSFLDEVKQFGYPITLSGRITKLGKVFEMKNEDALQKEVQS